MRLSLALALLTAAMGLASPAANPDPDAAVPEAIDMPAAAMEVRDLLAEAEETQGLLTNQRCDYNGCKCMNGVEGVYCGSCKHRGRYVITEKRKSNHVYQCGRHGNCCDFGYRRDCETNKRRCG
ncbi:hypothetical protein P885DRAFT_77456 [Corynascus similis CBS 632.67]